MSQFRKMVESKLNPVVNKMLMEAKQVGTLYHATDFNGLAAILGTNKMMANWSQGISFTRNKYYFYGDFPYQLVFDGNKLSEHYKVYPFNFQYFGYNNTPGFEGNYQTKHPDDNLEAEVCVVSKGRKYPDYYTDLKKPFFGTYGDEYNKNWNEILNIKSYIIGLLINHAFTTENEAKYAERLFKEYFKDLPVEHLNTQNTSFKKTRAKHDKAREEYFSNLITFDDIQKEIFKDKGWTDWDEWGKLTPDERGELIKEYEQILSKKYPNKKLASEVNR